MYVHHTDATFKDTVQVGAYRVPFEKGRAQVVVPAVLAYFRDHGWTITEDRERPRDAKDADIDTPPTIAPDLPEASIGEDWDEDVQPD